MIFEHAAFLRLASIPIMLSLFPSTLFPYCLFSLFLLSRLVDLGLEKISEIATYLSIDS